MVGKEKVEKMLRQCADTAEMPGWNDALTVMTESVQKKAAALSDDELFSVAAGARPKIEPSRRVEFETGSTKK